MNKWVALVSLIAANVVQQPAPLAQLDSGLVRGRVSDSGKFYQYFGIPYGLVTDQNRFQAPLPVPPWDGIFEAADENTRCPQKMIGSVILGDPNCLKVFVYTPADIKHDKPLPVMVFIHGGCFLEGTGSPFLYGGDFFAERGVVFVGINYRLSVEGFLCLGIKEAPGNAGLKDQIAALKWVQRNIAAFGGDPESVTVFGESAGAVSISYLLLSPAAKGLFSKVILQSGATTAPWGMQHDPLKTAISLARDLGYDTTDPYEIYQIVSNKTVNELISGIKYTQRKSFITSETLFVPCVENEIPGVEPVITEFPSDIIKSGNYTKLPMIMGFNDNEGIYFAAKAFGTSLKHVNPDEILPPELEFPSQKDRKELVERIRKRYFSSRSLEKMPEMINYYSDVHFKVPSILEMKHYMDTNDKPIYYYLFKYSGYINMPKIISGFGLMGGASHADELFYLFKPHAFPLPHRYLESKMIKRMVAMWINFAKYGDPTPTLSEQFPFKWKPSRESNPIALIIDKTLSTAPLWHEPAVNFWNETYNKFRRKTYGFKRLNDVN